MDSVQSAGRLSEAHTDGFHLISGFSLDHNLNKKSWSFFYLVTCRLVQNQLMRIRKTQLRLSTSGFLLETLGFNEQFLRFSLQSSLPVCNISFTCYFCFSPLDLLELFGFSFHPIHLCLSNPNPSLFVSCLRLFSEVPLGLVVSPTYFRFHLFFSFIMLCWEKAQNNLVLSR